MGKVPKKPVDKPHKCPKCPKSYASTAALKIHNRSKHLGVKFVCQYSGYEKEYSSKGALKLHVKSAHQNARFPCPISDCGTPRILAGTTTSSQSTREYASSVRLTTARKSTLLIQA